MGVVDIQLDGVKEVLHCRRRRVTSVDEVLALASHHYLTRDGDFAALLEANGGIFGIFIVENNRNLGSVDTSLALFVDELTQISRANL